MENEPRFTVNGDGTVTDNETSLIWLQDAGCLPASDWSQAQQACAGLQSGECGLSDGSHPGDWRLASMDELLTLVDYHFLPALSNTQGDGPWKQGDPFLNVMTNNPYWSATPAQQNPQGLAWEDAFNNGNFYNDAQSSPRYVWPVRGTVSPPVSPRFTDNGDGTVTDNQTGLLWLKNANCFGLQVWDRAAALASALGSGQCGLNDGSQPGTGNCRESRSW